MHSFYLFGDAYLIWFYRVTGYAYADFLLGTFVLACHALIIGEITIYLAMLVVRKRIDQTATEAAKYQDLSVDALKASDKQAYNAANKLANEAFGRSFFLNMALSAAFLWPVGFALAWMQTRFLEVEFPLPFLGFSLGYIGVFIILYIVAFFLFKKMKRTWLFVRKMNVTPDADNSPARDRHHQASLPTPDGKQT